MNQEDKSTGNEKSLLDRIRQTAIVIGAVIGVISSGWVIVQGVDAYLRAHQGPTLTITNHLALPITIVVNESSAYKYRVEPDSSITVTLLSEYDFPARIHWSVIRNRNSGGGGGVIGEAISGDFPKIDKGREVNITNISDGEIYFYPVIANNSDQKCNIVVNDGLITEYEIGVSSPHKTANLTGYFKYAKNSNVTLYCNDKAYWHGIRNNQASADKLPIKINSGITEISFP